MKQLPLCLYLASSLAAIAAPTGPAAVIHRDIDKLVAIYTDGFGYNNAKMRHVTFGSLFNAKRQDAVAFFSLGGVDNSNVHFEYIAIFAQGQERDFSDVKGPRERPIRFAAHGWLCTASRLRRRTACGAKPRLAPSRGGF